MGKKFTSTLLLAAVLAPASYADVTLSNSTLKVTTPALSASFQGMNIQSLLNSLTNEQNISQPGPGWMDLSMQQATGEPLRTSAWKIQPDPVTSSNVGVISASDSVRQVTVKIGTDPDSGEIVFSFQGQSQRPGLRNVFFGMQGFDPAKGRFLLPAHAGIYFDANTTPAALQMEYPTHWEAQFVVYETSRGGVLIYARDPRPYFKRVQASRAFGTLDLGLEIFAPGPWSSATETPAVEWRIRAFQGNWRTAVDAYRSWSDGVWAKREPDRRRDWVRRVKAVITIIDPVVDYIDLLAQRLDPSKTLLYVANWRKDSYDVNYPDYTPSPQITAFMDRAHSLGFHVMLHANALGVATYNPVYEGLSQYQLRDPDSGDLVYWPQGLWPAGPPPPFFIQSFAFISPCSSTYRSIFIDALRPMIEALQPDALHLDAGGVMLNDGNGLIEGMTSMEGMIQLHKDVAAAFPQVAFSYESMTEILASLQDFAQRWASDYPPHPISTYLMGDRVNFYGFLDQPPADEPGFIDYIKRYEAQGVMPTIPVNSLDELRDPPPITSRVLETMSLWQQYDFRPDWNGDWTGLAFRYISADGSMAATVSDQGELMQSKVGDQIIYQRVHDANTIQTSSFISDWTAYDDTNLYGLDPAEQYWLRPDISRPESALHLAGLPSNVYLGSGTLRASDYGYFELDPIAPPSFDFIGNFSNAKPGTDYLRKDYPLGAGDLVQVTRTSIAGQPKSPVILMQPPYRLLGAAVFLDYEIPVPSTPSIFTFSAGLSDSSPASDGATFVLRINGADAWSKTIKLGQLSSGQVDLTPWAEQTIHLRFIVHPGPLLNPIGDLGCWADLSLTTRPDSDPVPFHVILPDGASSPAIGGTAQLTGEANGQDYAASSPVPGKFSIFSKSPARLAKGQSLLDLPFDVWKMGYGGRPFPFRVGPSGTIQPVVSGGQTEAKALQTFPPQNGLTLITWGVQLPPDASTLDFKFGLADPLPPLPATVSYSQTGFSVKINGETLWSQVIQINGWNSQSADISKWAGQNVVIQIAVDALGQGTFNWSDWAGLTVN